jgi:hypothetical protein
LLQASSLISIPLTLTMEVVYFSKMSVNFYQITWHHISEDTILHNDEPLGSINEGEFL